MASDAAKMVQGLPEAKGIFAQLAQLPDILEAELNRTASEAMAKAQAMVPVQTGRLRASIQIVREKNSVTLKAGKFYGRFVEWGTKRMKPEPFLRPAMKEALQQLNMRIQQRIGTIK